MELEDPVSLHSRLSAVLPSISPEESQRDLEALKHVFSIVSRQQHNKHLFL